MKTTFKGREVEFDISHGRSDVVDSFVQTASWLDVEEGFELGDEDLESLTNQLHEDGTMYEEWIQHKVGEAEFYASRD